MPTPTPRLRNLIPGCALGLAISCAPAPTTVDSSSSAATAVIRPPTPAELLALHTVIADDRRDLPVDREGAVLGLLQISDDQMSNTHGASVFLFGGSSGTGPSPVPGGSSDGSSGCVEALIDEDGLRCVAILLCPPPPPSGEADAGGGNQPLPPPSNGMSGGGSGSGTMPPPTVGAIEVAATFDTIRLEPAEFGYPSVNRRGPFWSGDGDRIALTIEGKRGVAPPISRQLRAPVPDAVTELPKFADRNEPLIIRWRYADGKSTAPGHMTFGLTQFGGSSMPPPPNGSTPSFVNIPCGAPASKRAMRIPPVVLQRLQPGAAFASIQSTTEEETIVEGSLRLSVDVTASVDTGSSDVGTVPGGDTITIR